MLSSVKENFGFVWCVNCTIRVWFGRGNSCTEFLQTFNSRVLSLGVLLFWVGTKCGMIQFALLRH